MAYVSDGMAWSCWMCGKDVSDMPFDPYDVPEYDGMDQRATALTRGFFYMRCQKCTTLLCSKCAAEVDPATVHRLTYDAHSRYINKMDVCDDGPDGVRGQRDDDAEPHECVKMACCPGCHVEDCPMLVGTLVAGPCGHCGGRYDAGECSGCSAHPGEHDMPVDEATGLPVFRWLGENDRDQRAFLWPGEWRCCGAVCYHDTPRCPYWSVADRSMYARETRRLGRTRGCIDTLHATAEAAAAAEDARPRRAPHPSVGAVARALQFSHPGHAGPNVDRYGRPGMPEAKDIPFAVGFGVYPDGTVTNGPTYCGSCEDCYKSYVFV
jgi:hypothetical protein